MRTIGLAAFAMLTSILGAGVMATSENVQSEWRFAAVLFYGMVTAYWGVKVGMLWARAQEALG